MCERKLLSRDLVRSKPTELRDVVGRLRVSVDDPGRPVEIQGRLSRAVPFVAVDPDSEELERLDGDAGFLPQLPADAVERMLLLVEEPAGEVPLALERIDRPTREQEAPLAVHADRTRGRLGARIGAEAAVSALGHPCVDFDLRCAARAVLPLVELAHVGTIGS